MGEGWAPGERAGSTDETPGVLSVPGPDPHGDVSRQQVSAQDVTAESHPDPRGPATQGHLGGEREHPQLSRKSIDCPELTPLTWNRVYFLLPLGRGGLWREAMFSRERGHLTHLS